MEELKRAMEELRSSTKKLNKITDEANALVRDVEEFLTKECGVGTYSSKQVSHSFDPDSGILDYTELVFARVNGKFRIAITNGTQDNPGEPPECVTRPWSECTREEKIDTLPHLPALILQIAKSTADQASTAEKNVSEVTRSLSAVLPKKGVRS